MNINYTRQPGGKKYRSIVWGAVLFLTATTRLLAADVTFAPGAYIIDMGVMPQTAANGLKPYGLVYNLVVVNQIPVTWVINTNKVTDKNPDVTIEGADFTHNGKTYRGGPFIIPAVQVTDAVTNLIATWRAKGVVVDGPITNSFTAPVFDVITSFPNVVLDTQNGGKLITAFYTPSEIPAPNFIIGTPNEVSECHDVYGMPHADPQNWDEATRAKLLNFILQKGGFWASCHSVSAMEALPPTYPGLNFLSTSSLVPWGDHINRNTPPFLYNTNDPSIWTDPLMQFVGKVDLALQGGSEEIFVPDGNGWAPHAKVAVFDKFYADPRQPWISHTDPSKAAALVVFGNAYNNTNYGHVLYVASHAFQADGAAQNTAVGRMWGNLVLRTGLIRRPHITFDDTLPDTVEAGQTIPVNVHITGTGAPFTILWTATGGGTFGNPNAASTTFTAPALAGTCIIRVSVVDACGRAVFSAQVIVVYSKAGPPVYKTASWTNSPGPAFPGDQIDYHIKMGNHTNNFVLLTGARVTDFLPPNTTYKPASASPPLSSGPDPLVWNLGTNVADVPGVVNTASTSTFNTTANTFDTYLNHDHNGRNYGGATNLLVSGNAANEKRALVSFDLSSLPTNTPILSATLTLTKIGGTAIAPRDISVHRLTNDWTENTLNDSNGQANWQRRKNGVNWVRNGGDFVVAGESTNSVAVANGPYSWNVSAAIASAIATPGAATTNGFLLRYNSSSLPNDSVIFASSENSAGNGPKLTVIFAGGAAGTVTRLTVSPYRLIGSEFNLPTVTVTMEVIVTGNSTNVTVTPPANLTVIASAGATAARQSGPSPASAIVPAGGGVATFTYQYDVTGLGTAPGSLRFSGKPADTSGVTYATATSGSILTVPTLNYSVFVNAPLPALVQQIPNTATFSDTTSYLPGQFDVTSEEVLVPVTNSAPDIGVAKAVTSITNLADGRYKVAFEFAVTNLGAVTVSNVQVGDNLNAAFAGHALSAVSVTTTPNLTPNPSYNGVSVTNLLTGANALAARTGGKITLTVTVAAGSTLSYTNQAVASATDISGTIPDTDLSDNGTDPDANHDGDPTEPGENDPTPVTFIENQAMAVTKSLVSSVKNSNGTFTVTYAITVENPGAVNLSSVQVSDRLTSAFPAPATVTVNSLSSARFTVNPGYNGISDTNLLAPSQTLPVGDQGVINLTVTINKNGSSTINFTNQAIGTAVTPASQNLSTPGTAGVTLEAPGLAVTKQVTSIVPNGTNFSVTMRIDGRNVGDVALKNFQLSDDLDSTFSGVLSYSVTSKTATGATLNTNFNGVSDINLLVGTNTLAIGATGTVFLTVSVVPGFGTTFENIAASVGTSISPGGETVTAISDPVTIAPSRVQGTLYLDHNTNGVFDAGDDFFPYVDVVITTSSNATYTVTSDSLGHFLAMVPPGDTTVNVNELDPQFPTNATLTVGSTDPTTVVVPANGSATDDTGYLLPPGRGFVNGYVFLDNDGDGLRDFSTGDAPIINVDVRIFDQSGITNTVTTESHGYFAKVVPAGKAIVDVITTDTNFPAGQVLTIDDFNQGGDPTMVLVPDGGVATDDTGYITPDPETGQVVGIVYLDLNTNGVFDVFDSPLAGLHVAITDTNGFTLQVSTSPSGFYSLLVDPAGLMVVNVLTNDPAFPPGATVTVGTTNPSTLNVPAGGTARDDNGFRLPPGRGLVSGVVYVDNNNNGIFEPGVDTPIPDITVNITATNSVLQSVVTDAEGFYSLLVTNGITIVDVDTSDPDFPANLTLTTDANNEGSDPTAVLVPNGGAATDNTGYTRLNRVPAVVNDLFFTTQNILVGGNVLTNDNPGDTPISSLTILANGSHGNAVLNTNGTFTYTPALNFGGTDTFVYQLCDANGDCGTATVTIQVNGLPVVNNDTFTVNEDTLLSGNVAANDLPSLDGGNIWTLLTPATNGVVTFNPDGTFTYQPNTNYHGPDSFRYRVCDVTPDCSSATASITVTPVNDAPVAANDTYTTPEDAPLIVPASGVLTNDTDVDGDALTAVLVTGPSHGTLTLNPNGSFTYTPTNNYNGADSFTYRAFDGTNNSGVTTASITITELNDPPVADNQSVTMPEDTSTNLVLTASDVDSATLTFAIVTGPTNGTLSLLATNTGAVTYTPNTNFSGDDTFTFLANDGTNDSAPATVSITVTPVDDLPVANPDSYTATEDVVFNGDVTPNDVPSGDGGNLWTVLTNAAHGVVVMSPDGTFSYTPATNYTGADIFTYQVCDADNDCSSTTVTLTVESVDDLPVANPDSYTATEDVVLNGDVATNDAPSGDGGNLWTVLTNAAHGVVVMSPDGTFSYTPAADYNGADSFTYQVCDADNDCSSTTVTITVGSVDDLPVANPDSYEVNEDTVLNGDVATNDAPSGDGGNLWTVLTNAAHGVVVMSTDGTFSYTPATNYNGPDSFTYQVCDADNDCSSTTVTLTVESVDDLPVANPDSYTVDEDVVLNGDVTTNDAPSGDGGNLWTVLTNAAHGVVVMSPDGTFSYTPATNYTGADSFTYQVCDADNDCSSTTVTLTVESVDDLPVANPDSYTATEDVVLNGDVATNDAPSGDGGNLWTVLTNAAHGVVVMSPDGTFSYTPATNYNGPDSFTYQVCDADNDCSSTTVTITVESVDDLPVANPDSYTATEDVVLNGDVTTNDVPSGDGGNLWTVLTNAAHGVVVMSPNGTFSYTPTADYTGADSFTYQVCDADNDCSSTTVTITVESVDDLPVANPDSYTATEDVVLNGDVTTNDVPSGDGGNLWTVLTNAAHGVVVMSSNGTFSYTPAADYTGADSFTYQVCDADNDCSSTTVTITVGSVDDLPVANPDSYTATEDVVLNGDVATNDAPSGDGGNLWTVLTNAAHGVVVMSTDGTFSYTPATNYNGPDSFTYQVCDADNDCSSTTVTLTVESVDDLPVANPDSYTATEDVVFNGDVATNDAPSGDGGNLWTVLTNAAHGVVVMSTDGTFSYTPATNYNGPDSFTYQVCDADNDCSSTTVTLTVESVDDLPVANPDSYTATEDVVLNGDVATNDAPSGDGGNLWTVLTNAAHGVVVMSPDGTFSYTPAADYNGADSFTYQVCDADNDCSSTTVTLTVESVDDLPVANPDSYTATEDVVLNGDVATNDAPSGDGGNLWTVLTNAAHGVVVMSPDGTFSYTPATNYNGPDSFTYQVCDADNDCSSTTVTLTVESVDDLPVANPDSYTATEDVVLNGDVTTNDVPSGDGGNLWTVLTNAAHGVVVMSPNGTFSYTPAADYTGADSFTYQVCDADNDCSSTTVTITVGSVDDLPVANPDSYTATEDVVLNGDVATNDAPSGDGGNLWTVLTNAAHGVVVMSPNGTFSYTPATNYTGADSFTYQVCDADNDCSSTTVTITVESVDDLPVANPDSYEVNEDTVLNGDVTTNDVPSGDGGNLWTVLTNAAHGVVVMSPNGTFSYTPAADYTGADSFTYQVCDADNDCSSTTVTITVGSVDDLPVANPDSYEVNEDTVLNGDVTTNDAPSGDGGNLWTVLTNAAHGVVVMSPDGTFSYTPAADYTGADSFTYQVCDADNDCSSTTVTITVGSVDDLPVANPDSYTATEDVILNGDVATNDAPSGDGGNLWTVLTNAAHGVVVMSTDGTFSYTPATNYNGPDSFTYQVCDADNDCSSTTVTLTVESVDDLPVANPDSYLVTEDVVFNGDVTTNDVPSGDGGNLWTVLTNAAHGVVVMSPDGTFSYTPAADYTGADSFTYQVCDADNDCSSTTVTITVGSVDDVPVANPDSYEVNEDTVLNGDVATNDVPSGDGGNLWTVLTNAAHGVVVMSPNGTFSYTPAANYTGADIFTYQVCDVDNDCSSTTVTITVGSVDDLPVANPDSYEVNEDTVLNGDVTPNDVPSGDGGNLWTVLTNAAHGVVVMSPNGTFSYTPAADYTGADSFTYQVCDADNDCSSTTVTITVGSVDDVPVANPDSYTVDEDVVLNGDVTTNDVPSGDGGNLWTVLTNAAHGVVVMSTDGTFSYTPATNYTGPDSFTYQVCDVDNDCSSTTVTITVESVNDLPVANPDSYEVNEDTVLNGDVTTNDVPSGDGGNLWTVLTNAAHGVVVMSTDGTFSYTPATNYTGPDSFTYQVCDADNDCSSTTVTITVGSVDDVPVANPDSYEVNEDTVLNGDVATNDAPSGDGGNLWTVLTNAAHGVVVMSTDGTFSYTPAADYTGADSFTYQVCDADNDCSSTTVTITVGSVDDVPVANPDSYEVNEDTVLNGDVTTNDVPSGDGGNLWTVLTNAAHGVVVMSTDGTFSYTPATNYTGPDSFTYQVCDVDNDCSSTTVTITVESVNDLPVANPDSYEVNEDTVLNGDVTTNDVPSGDGGNLWTVLTNAAHGVVVMSTDGTFSYTPAADYNGADSFTYQVCDADNDCSSTTVTLTVGSVDDVPVANPDSYEVNEDTVLNGDVTTNDVPSGDGGNVWTVLTNAAHGVVVMSTDGTFSYTPATNYTGADSFTYQVCDADNDCSSTTVTLTVGSVDDVPVANPDTYTATEDVVFNGDVTTNDVPSGDGGNLWTVLTNAAHGVVVMSPNGTFSYTPAADYTGADSFTYQVCDADNDCSSTTVTITVGLVNDVPLANPDSYLVTEDVVFNGDVTTNDVPSGDGGNLWTVLTNAAHGVVVMSTDGTFSYTPATNYTGPDSFTYQVCDADNDCSSTTVTITVGSVDDLPVANPDSYTATEDVVLNGDVATNDAPSGDGGNLWTVLTNAAHGVVVMSTDGTFSYTPATNYNGPDSFTYQVCDADNDCSSTTVTLTVESVDDLPVANPDSYTATEDVVLNGDVATNDVPSGDGGNLWTVLTNAAHGVVVMSTDGTFSYTPAADYTGADSFTYQVCDADNDCSSTTVTITVGSVNDVPLANPDSYLVTEDVVFNGDVTTNDVPSGDGGNVWTVLTNAAHGVVVMSPNGTFSYTPAADYTGADSFTYQVCDADNDCSSTTVTLTVGLVNDVPLANPDSYLVTEDVVFNGDVTTNDVPSGDGGNLWTVLTNAAHGVVVMSPNGTFSYTPAADYTGADSFTYQVCDADNDCSSTTVTITVGSVDDVPVANPDSYEVNEDTVLNGDVTTNDVPSGDGGNLWTVLTNAAHGVVVMSTDGTFSYTPATNYTGPDSFTYQVCDADNDCSSTTVTITVGSVDDVPVANPDSYEVNEDTVLNGDVTTNDVPSGDGGNLWTVLTNAAHGVVVMSPNGTFSYTPAADYTGADSFTYQVCDADNDCSSTTVTITVGSVDDVPVANPDSYLVTEDVVFNGDVTTNDVPSGDGGNVWTVLTNAAHGVVVMSPNGTFSYTPAADYTGADSFTYQVCDADNDCSSTTVTITVGSVNDVPVANPDSYEVNEDTVLNGDVTTNDVPSGDGGNVWTVLTNAAHGVVVMSPNGTFSYTPATNYTGADSFTYQVCDADNDCSSTTVTLTVGSVDDVPVANPDSYEVNEDTVLNGDVTTNDVPSGDGGNVWTVLTNAAHGVVVMSTDGTFSYTPATNYTGADSFTYQVCDADNDCSSTTVTLTVGSVDDVPVANPDTYTATEDVVFNGDVTTNDVPSGDGGNLWTVLTNAAHGVVVMSPNGTFSYTPAADYTGADSFTYQVCDADNDCSSTTVTITVGSVDDVPVANPDSYEVNEDTVLNGDVTTNDVPSGDGGNLWTVLTNAAHGVVVMSPNGTFSYTPAADYTGADSFTYQVCDVDNDCSSTTVTITVGSVDDVPVANPDSYLVTEDVVFNGDVTTNDVPSGDGGNLWTVLTNAAHGVVVMSPNGTFSYTPAADYTGADSFTYQVCDADNDCASTTVTITVGSVNDVPVANPDSYTATEDVVLNGNVATNDVPSGDGGNVWTVLTNAAHGVVVMSPNGTFSYTPATDYTGADSFTYQVCDADNDCSSTTVTLTVGSVDDLPVANPDSYTATEDVVLNGDVATNDVPSGDGGNLWTVLTNAAHGVVVMSTDGTFSYTPAADYTGADSFTYQVCDADNDCSSTTVTITVGSVNDVPLANPDSYLVTEDVVFNGDVTTNDVPSGDGGNVWTVLTNAAHGVVVMSPNGTFSYTPAADYTGADSFTYQVCDADNDCSSTTVTLTVGLVNDVPLANPDSYLVTEDVVFNGDVTTNDVPSGDGGNLWTVLTNAAHGVVVMSPNGTFSYTPAADYTGADSFTYQVCDADNDCSSTTVTITVGSVDDVPVANPDSYEVNEDTVLNGDVTTNDVPSGDGGNLWTVLTNAAHGVVVMSPNGTFSYTPAADYTGADSFTYQVCDVDNDCSSTTVTITVGSVDDVPVANPDSYLVTEDVVFNGDVTTNDVPSGDGGNLWTVLTNAAHGVVVMSPNGTFSYTPAADYTGADSFTYQVCDADNDCASTTVTITVGSVNDVPVANPDTYTATEDVVLNGDVTTNDVPSGDGGNVWTVLTNAAHGVVVMSPNGTFSYTPAADYTGADSFTYQVCDADNDCSSTTVTLTVESIDDLPVANPDTYTATEDVVLNGDVTTNDVPSGDGGNLWTVLTNAAHGVVVMSPNGTFSYTPAADYTGADSFTYQVCDADNDCASTTVTITVGSVDDVPVANPDSYLVTEDVVFNGDVTTNDVPSGDGGNLWTVLTNAAHGVVVMSPNGTFSYTPAADYTGADSFTYQVCDADNDCSSTTVTITVGLVNDVPLANPDSYLVTEDVVFNGDVTTNDVPSGDGGNLWTVLTNAAHGVVVMSPNGTFSYTPAADYTGADSFTYQVCDADNDCSSTTVTITVGSVDDVPVANPDSYTATEDVVLNGDVTTNDVPSGDGGNLWTVLTNAAHGVVVMSPNGTFSYTPAADYTGADSFTYQVCDVDNDCSSTTVTITVGSVDDVPVANPDSYLVTEDVVFNGDVTTNDVPSGDGGNLWTVLTNAAHGVVVMSPNGTFSYTPAADYTGADSFTYQVCDADNDCSSTTVTLTVGSVNDVPVANPDSYTATEDVVLNGNVTTNDVPSGDGGNVWTVLTNAAHGVVVMSTNGTFSYTPAADYNGPDSFTYQVCDVNNDCSSTTVTITVTATEPHFGILAGTNGLNRQTGLFEQRVTVTNTGTETAAAVRLLVGNIRSLQGVPRTNVFLYNAAGTNTDGRPYVQNNAPLDPGRTVTLMLEFYVPDLRPFTNTLEAVAILPPPVSANGGAGIVIDRSFVDWRIPGERRYVIEFASIPGRTYTIIYSDDNMSTWKVATPSITANANRTQWYDDGPPKTDTKPLLNGSRFYGVIPAP